MDSLPRTAEAYRAWFAAKHPDIEYGQCACGCGKIAPLAPRTDRTQPSFKGEPRRFVNGHQNGLHHGPAYRIEEASGCWTWLHGIHPNGYGYVGRGSERRYAHRAYYEAARGPLPPGVEIHHECRNKSCVNPDHLKPLTPSEHTLTHARYGDDNPNTKYSEAQVSELSRLRNGGATMRDAAFATGIDLYYAYDLLGRRPRRPCRT